MQTFTFFVLAIVAGSALASLDEEGCKKELQSCQDATNQLLKGSKGAKDLENVEERLKSTCKLYAEGLYCLDDLAYQCEMAGDIKTLHDKIQKNFTDESRVCSRDGTLNNCGSMMIGCVNVYEEAKHYLEKKDVDNFCFDALVYEDCMETTKDLPSCLLPKVIVEEFELRLDSLTAECGDVCLRHLNKCVPKQKDPDCQALRQTKSCLEKLNSEKKCDNEKTQKAFEEAINFRAAKLEEKNCPDGAPSVSVSGAVLLLTVVATFLGRQL